MGVKRVIDNQAYIKPGDPGADLTASFTFPTIDVLYVDNLAMSLKWDGDPTGIFTIQESVDGVTWFNTLATFPPAASPDAPLLLVPEVLTKYMRLFYSFTSGSSTTVTAAVVAKSVSG